MFKKVKDAPALVKNLRVMLMFDIGLYHVAVYDDSGIRSLKDIKGKKVFLGPPGGAALRVAKTFVKAATGYEAGKDFDSVKLSWDAAGAAFQDRRLDVYINPTNPPSPVIQQVALTNKIRFLPLEDAVFETPAVKKLFKIPGRTRGNIAAKAYGKNQMNAGPTQSMGALVGVATRAGMSADTVYRMTKAFWEGAEEMRSTAPWLREIKLENALSAANIPLHPGAAKYYREIGMKVPEKLLAK
jgi:hypothetical protein